MPPTQRAHHALQGPALTISLLSARCRKHDGAAPLLDLLGDPAEKLDRQVSAAAYFCESSTPILAQIAASCGGHPGTGPGNKRDARLNLCMWSARCQRASSRTLPQARTESKYAMGKGSNNTGMSSAAAPLPKPSTVLWRTLCQAAPLAMCENHTPRSKRTAPAS